MYRLVNHPDRRTSTDPPAPGPLDELLAAIRDARFGSGLQCPRCHADRHIQRWGSFRGRQRYRCFHCGRTFSDLTGSPAAYSKKLVLWAPYANCLDRSLSIRQAAAAIEVHSTTAFRWRHKLLDALRTRDVEPLMGWIEILTLQFPYSEKGRRPLDRPPRRHGPRRYLHPITLEARGTPFVVVLVACDRTGHVVTSVLRYPWAGQLFPFHLHEALDRRLGGAALTLTALKGPLGAAGVFARRHHGRFHDARPSRIHPETRSLAHVRTVREYTHRLHAWIERFRGVATRYLPNYLVWHRTLDHTSRNHFAVTVLRWPFTRP